MKEQNNTMNALFSIKSVQNQQLSEYHKMVGLAMNYQYPQPRLMPNDHQLNTTTTIICENRCNNYLGERNMPNEIITKNMNKEDENSQKKPVTTCNANVAYLHGILLKKLGCESIGPSVIRCIGDLNGRQLDFVANVACCFAKGKGHLIITSRHLHLALQVLFGLIEEEFSLSSFSYPEVTQ